VATIVGWIGEPGDYRCLRAYVTPVLAAAVGRCLVGAHALATPAGRIYREDRGWWAEPRLNFAFQTAQLHRVGACHRLAPGASSTGCV
jgi:hypothetical protein